VSSTIAPEASRVAATGFSPATDADRVASPSDSRVLLLAALGASALYMFWRLDRGWVGHDDGALGEAAMRLMRGQLAYRDFDGIYTGGLDYLYAGAFRLLGTSLLTIRLVLFAACMAWLPAVYYIASRFVKPAAANGVMLVAMVWSIPNYPAGMPSWYNLFLATFGVAALFKYLESRRLRWVALAGVIGGLSFLVKVIGLYYVAGALLFLVYQAHAEARAASSPHATSDKSRGMPGLAYAGFITAALLAFDVALWVLVRHQFHSGEVLHFVLPGTAIVAVLAYAEWNEPAGEGGPRFAALARLLLPFLLGIAIPVALFLAPYAMSGSLGAFGRGVFLLPMKRFGFATMLALPLASFVSVVPLVVLAMLMRRYRGRLGGIAAFAVVAAFAAMLVVAHGNDRFYRGVWFALRDVVPPLIVIAAVLLARWRPRDTAESQDRARTMALACVTAVCSLVQFPFSAPIYFCYVAPLALLLSVALFRHIGSADRVLPASALAFCACFAIWTTNDSTLEAMGAVRRSYPPTMPLGLPRGGVRVQAEDAAQLRVLIPALEQRARGGYTWASPDCPQIYFLSGLRNPTRTLFDFFDDPDGRTARILGTLEQHGVTAIVLMRSPSFSEPITADLYTELVKRYPFSADVGRYQVRWRS
jgi:hypothetical protein